MRRIFLAVLACFGLTLAGADQVPQGIATVVVYPFSGGNDTSDREASSRIATILATSIAEGGVLKIVPPQPGIERKDFLGAARAAGADYYVTGYLSSLGTGVAIVEQVVSCATGVVIFSNSGQISAYAEVAAQGDTLREGIIVHAVRNLASFGAPPAATPAPKPEPSNDAADSGGIGAMFKRKKPPAPAAVVTPPANATFGILTLGGTADEASRSAAAQELAASFVRAGRHAVVTAAVTPSSAVCKAADTTMLVAGWLDTSAPPAAKASATLRFIAYDCAGNVTYDKSFQSDGAGAQAAVDGVVDAAVVGYVNPKPAKP